MEIKQKEILEYLNERIKYYRKCIVEVNGRVARAKYSSFIQELKWVEEVVKYGNK